MDNYSKDMTCKFAKHTNEGVYCHKREKGNRIADASECEDCDMYKSRYITFPIQVNEIEVKEYDRRSLEASLIGKPVKVSPCAERFEGKTYIGIFLGDLPLCPTVSYNEEHEKLTVGAMMNPAIFIPEKKEIVFGAESYWSRDLSLNEITDDIINNQWYIQAMRSMECQRDKNGDNENRNEEEGASHED